MSTIDESFDYICAERLTPNLVWMAQHLAQKVQVGEVAPIDPLQYLARLNGLGIKPGQAKLGGQVTAFHIRGRGRGTDQRRLTSLICRIAGEAGKLRVCVIGRHQRQDRRNGLKGAHIGADNCGISPQDVEDTARPV